MPRARKRNTTSNPVPSNMTAKQIRRKKPIDASYMVPINPLTPNQETCLLYTSPSPRDVEESRMPSSA